MGNCQVTDAAAVVLQHPNGRVERLYWPTSAGEVMRSHPGHYVTLVSLCISEDGRPPISAGGETLRITRVRLLRHKDILLVGQIYRLVTSQEVAKALNARRQERMKKAQAEQQRLQHSTKSVEEGGAGQVGQQEGEKERQRGSRQWRPSLQSISEFGA